MQCTVSIEHVCVYINRYLQNDVERADRIPSKRNAKSNKNIHLKCRKQLH